jgi:AcrR family transcriptional regulator
MDAFTGFTPLPTESPSPSSPRRSTEVRRQEVVLTVLTLAGEIGVAAITTQAIAERMGLTQGAVFRHFPNKEAIWSAVMDWVEARLDEVYRGQPGNTPLAEARRIFAAYTHLFMAYPAVPRLFFCDTFHHPYPELHARLQAMVRACQARLGALLARAVDEGRVRADVSAPVAANLFLACVQGLAFQTCVLGIVDDPIAEGQPLLDLYLAGLGAGKEAP